MTAAAPFPTKRPSSHPPRRRGPHGGQPAHRVPRFLARGPGCSHRGGAECAAPLGAALWRQGRGWVVRAMGCGGGQGARLACTSCLACSWQHAQWLLGSVSIHVHCACLQVADLAQLYLQILQSLSRWRRTSSSTSPRTSRWAGRGAKLGQAQVALRQYCMSILRAATTHNSWLPCLVHTLAAAHTTTPPILLLPADLLGRAARPDPHCGRRPQARHLHAAGGRGLPRGQVSVAVAVGSHCRVGQMTMIGLTDMFHLQCLA